jgi:antirestriction protein ArdC
MTKNDVYAEVTDRIVAALEQGVVPWRKPWRSLGGPRNLNGRPYRGINVFLLELAGFGDPRWGTFNAVKAAGGSVRKGEKGTRIILWKPVRRRGEDENGEQQNGSYLLLKEYTVFNAEQCDGLPELDTVEHEQVASADEVVLGYIDGPTLNYGGDRAYYSPTLDQVTVPHLGQFESADAYYQTLYHELVHSTGHESRLKRTEWTAFGSETYSREELVAELGAAMLCGVAGIQPQYEQSAAYIASWKSKLEDDPKLIVQAAAAAQKAADRILGTKFENRELEREKVAA